ncbi:MAG: DUF1559 domain-containing protein [Planctomycetaceae bacterium]
MQNHLSQIAVAIANYEMSFEMLPPGSVNDTGPILSEPVGYHVSWMVQILPQMDERNAFRKFDFAEGAYGTGSEPVRQYQINSYLCPSSYMVSALELVALTNYAGCHHHEEAQIAGDNTGLLLLNSSIRFEEIPDGSTHTLLLGEVDYQYDALGWVSGTRATLRNAGTLINNAGGGYRSRPTPGTPAPPTNEVGGFSSFHPGGAQFAIADGHVSFLSENIDPRVYQFLANRGDGELVGLP